MKVVDTSGRSDSGVKRHTVLYITHSWGGGTERHVQDLCRLVAAAGSIALIGRVDSPNGDKISIKDNANDSAELSSLCFRNGIDHAAEALRDIGITHIHVQHLAGFDDRAGDFVRLAAAAAGIDYDVTAHDFMAFCPRIHLVDGTGRYCGEPPERDCEECIQRLGSPFGRPAVWNWRQRHGRLLAGARKIFVPSRDAANRLNRFWPQLAFVVRPHPEPASRLVCSVAPPAADRSRRRIALLGALSTQKGAGLLVEVAKAARCKNLAVDFVLVGRSDRDDELKGLGIEIAGSYREGEGVAALLSAKVDMVWFASVSPETYSYTLSDAFSARIMPVGFDLGAIGERVRAARWGHLFAMEMMFAPDEIAEALAGLVITTAPSDLAPNRDYEDFFATYYELG